MRFADEAVEPLGLDASLVILTKGGETMCSRTGSSSLALSDGGSSGGVERPFVSPGVMKGSESGSSSSGTESKISSPTGMTGGEIPGANGSEDALSARDLRNSDANIKNSVSGVKDPTEFETYNI